MSEAKRDQNRVTTLLAVSSADGTTPIPLYADPITHRLYVDLSGAGSGTVTSVSVTTANGVSGTVANQTTTPAITLTLGDITPSSIAINGGTALTTSNRTGSGILVLQTSPTLITPTLGVATATSIGIGTAAATNYPIDILSSSAPQFIRVRSSDSFAFLVADGISNTGVIFNIGGVSKWQLYASPTGPDFKLFSAGTASDILSIDYTNGNTTFTGSLTASNLSGTNTGDNATNSQYSGLAASKADVGQTFYIGTTQVAINRASAGLTLAGLTLTTPDIGTPSAGTLTNCTGLPIAGLVASTSTAIGVGSIELGHATDTTITRVSAGVIAVEGATIPSVSSTSTLTNKRITKRVVTVTQSATPTINTDNTDIASITGLAQAITSMTTNLSGTPVAGDMLMIQITDDGTARAITWGASFQATTISLPTTTVISTMLRVLFQWNATASKWDCIGTA